MNILICVIILAIISFLNYRLGKSVFYPAFIFSCYWATLLLLLMLLPNNFYHLSNKSLIIFIMGAVFSSLGSFLVLRPGKKSYFNNNYHNMAIGNTKAEFDPWLRNCLLMGLAFSVMMLPYFCYYLYSLVTATYRTTSATGILHIMTIARELRSIVAYSHGLGIFKYLIAGVSFLALISVVEFSQGRCSRLITILYIVLTLIYHFLSTARTGLIFSILAFLMLYFMSQRKIKMSSIFFSIVFILIAFFLPAIILQKGSSAYAGTLQNMSTLFFNIQTYLVGSIVAFDKAISSPIISEYFPHFYSLRFFFSILQHLGFSVQASEIILPYFYTPYPINIYTMYFPWFIDFSWPGVAIITFLLGTISTVSYKSALRKEPLGLIFYSTIMAGILLGTIGDFFLIGLSFWIQLAFYVFLLYKTPLILNLFLRVKEKHAGNA